MDTPTVSAQKPPQTQPVRIKPKVGRNVISCSVVAVVFAVLIFSAFAVLIAKTGIVSIPFYSRFYGGPKPTRLVNATPQSIDAFRVHLAGLFTAQALSGKKPPYEAQITEKELSGVMETAIDLGLRDQGWKQVFTQIVIRPTGFEFLTLFQRGPWHIDMLARFTAVVRDGGLSFEPTEVAIGDYTLPASAAYKVVSFLFSRNLGTFFLSFADTRLKEVRLEEGVMTVVADITRTVPTPNP